MILLFQVLRDCSKASFKICMTSQKLLQIEMLLLIMQPLSDPHFGLQETLASSLPVGSFQGTVTSNFLRNDLTKIN